MACLRNVPVVFLKRQHSKRDEFDYRKFLPRQENSFPRGAVADCQNYFRARRAHLFCRRVVHNVRGLRLSAVNLQPADNLLFLRDDLSVIGLELADEFTDGFSARRSAVGRHAFTIRFLGHADFLEFKNDSRAVSFYLKAQSRVLYR